MRVMMMSMVSAANLLLNFGTASRNVIPLPYPFPFHNGQRVPFVA